MLDALFRLFLIMLLLTGTYALFGLINKPGTIPFSSPTVEGGLHVLYPELSFVFLAWLMFLLITHLRLTLLIGLVGGQALLAWPFSTVHFQHYSYPVYVLITVNCFYLLILYFYFSSDRWGSGSLKDATDVYKRNDS